MPLRVGVAQHGVCMARVGQGKSTGQGRVHSGIIVEVAAGECEGETGRLAAGIIVVPNVF